MRECKGDRRSMHVDRHITCHLTEQVEPVSQRHRTAKVDRRRNGDECRCNRTNVVGEQGSELGAACEKGAAGFWFELSFRAGGAVRAGRAGKGLAWTRLLSEAEAPNTTSARHGFYCSLLLPSSHREPLDVRERHTWDWPTSQKLVAVCGNQQPRGRDY